MNRKELRIKLKEANIKHWYYNIDGFGETDQRLCLEKKGEKWRVCFYERGIAREDGVFNTEEEACDYIFEMLIK